MNDPVVDESGEFPEAVGGKRPAEIATNTNARELVAGEARNPFTPVDPSMEKVSGATLVAGRADTKLRQAGLGHL